MILSKRSREGYLLLDHTASPGVPGLPKHLELATMKCSHCERIMVRNPARTRERAWCPQCDKYICDQCEALRAAEGCKTFTAKLEKHLSLNVNLGAI